MDFSLSNRFLRLSREGFWIVTGQVAAILGALVGVRVLTELLAPTAYGELALGMTIATLVNQTILGPISQGASRFYAPAMEQGDIPGYLRVVKRLVTLAAGVTFMLILVAAIGLVVAEKSDWLAITVAAFVFAIFGGCNSVLNGIQNAARQRSVVAIHQGMIAWARFLIAAGLIVLLGASSVNAMYGYVLATLLVLGSQSLFIRRIIPEASDRLSRDLQWRRQILDYSWPFGVWGIFYWAQSASDRWALGLFETSQEVGLYAVLFQIGYYPMSVATGLAVQFLAPILFHRAGDARDVHRNANVSHLTWWLAALAMSITGLAFMLALVFHQAVFKILVAREYWSVSSLLPWMLLAGGLFAAGQMMSLKMMSLMNTRALLPVKIVTAVFGVAFSFLGARWYGIAGVVAAMVMFALFYFSWSAILFARVRSSESFVLSQGNVNNEKKN